MHFQSDNGRIDIQRVSRRSFLAGSAAAVAGGVLLRGGPTGAVDDGVYPRYGWVPVSSFSTPGPPALLWPTLLPAGRLTPSTAVDAWYLWLWSHGDAVNPTTRLVLYTAPSAEGPYTYQGIRVSGMVSPHAPGYQGSHFAAGDIVWDASHGRYVSSPHSIRLSYDPARVGETPQDSFLIQSTDGWTWSWLDGDNSPRLLCGGPGTPDSIHTGYGRLLRDLDGHVTTVSGRYWWVYRAQRRDAPFVNEDGTAVAAPTLYRPWLASSTSLSTYPWVKEPSLAFYPATTLANLFAMGSFVRAASNCYVSYTDGGPIGFSPTASALVGPAAGPTDLATAPQVPLALAPDSSVGSAASTLLSSGANIIRDPSTGAQYLVTSNIYPDGTHTVITIYKAAT